MAREAKVVLDASVVTKWYNPEPDSDAALAYKARHAAGGIEVVEPSLLFYEVANALVHNPNFNEPHVRVALKALSDLSLTIQAPTPSLLASSVTLAKNHRLSIYDASYLAVAQHVRAPFVTADRKLWTKVRAQPKVILLGT